MGRQFKPGQLQTGSLYNISSSYALSASYAPFVATNTGSLLVTASISNANITFTKGDSTTFGITVNNVASASYAATASYLTGYISPFPYTGSAQITGSLGITGSLNVIGGITGSLLGTASYATTALSASYAPSTPAFPFTGSAGITGSLTVVGKTQSTQIGAGAAPSGSVPLDVRAQGALSSDTVFLVRNSADTQNLMSIAGNGQIAIGLSASINLAGNGIPEDAVVIGRGASAGFNATAVGAASVAQYYNSVAIGKNSFAGIESVAVGVGATAYNSSLYPTLAIGYAAVASALYSGVISVGNPGITNAIASSFAFGINNGGNAQSFFFNRNTNVVLRSNKQLTSATHFDADATNTITVHSGSIPITTISGAFQMYAATGSITNNARPHFRTGNGTIVWLGDESRLYNLTSSIILNGTSSAPSLNTTAVVTTTLGSNTIYSIPAASYDGAWFEYTVRSGSNARAGQIMSIWSGSSVNFTETTTTDFGTTAGIAFTVMVSGSNLMLTGSSATAGWTIKTIVRSI